jgi:hypothetical protein
MPPGPLGSTSEPVLSTPLGLLVALRVDASPSSEVFADPSPPVDEVFESLAEDPDDADGWGVEGLVVVELVVGLDVPPVDVLVDVTPGAVLVGLTDDDPVGGDVVAVVASGKPVVGASVVVPEPFDELEQAAVQTNRLTTIEFLIAVTDASKGAVNRWVATPSRLRWPIECQAC